MYILSFFFLLQLSSVWEHFSEFAVLHPPAAENFSHPALLYWIFNDLILKIWKCVYKNMRNMKIYEKTTTQKHVLVTMLFHPCALFLLLFSFLLGFINIINCYQIEFSFWVDSFGQGFHHFFLCPLIFYSKLFPCVALLKSPELFVDCLGQPC